MRVFVAILLPLLASFPAFGQLSGYEAGELRLRNGEILTDAEIQDVSEGAVVIRHGRTLESVPFDFLPPALAERARTEWRARAAAQDHAEGNGEDAGDTHADAPSPAERYRERRLAEIEANRQAERQAAVAAAKAGAAREREAPPAIEWNDLRLHSAKFGVGFGTAIVENTGRTSRTLENWDLKIIYADGYSRSVQTLRPYRIERQSAVQISFYIPDRYRVQPQFLKFDHRSRLLPAEINYLQSRVFGSRSSPYPYSRHPGRGRGRRPHHD